MSNENFTETAIMNLLQFSKTFYEVKERTEQRIKRRAYYLHLIEMTKNGGRRDALAC